MYGAYFGNSSKITTNLPLTFTRRTHVEGFSNAHIGDKYFEECARASTGVPTIHVEGFSQQRYLGDIDPVLRALGGKTRRKSAKAAKKADAKADKEVADRISRSLAADREDKQERTVERKKCLRKVAGIAKKNCKLDPYRDRTSFASCHALTKEREKAICHSRFPQ